MSRERIVLRHVAKRDAGEWLLAWASAGWVPATGPTVAGHADGDEPVLLVTLLPLGEHSDAPLEPEVPFWTPAAGSAG